MLLAAVPVPLTRQALDAHQAAHRFSAAAMLGVAAAHVVVFGLLAASSGWLAAPALPSALMVQMLAPTADPVSPPAPVTPARPAVVERKPAARPQPNAPVPAAPAPPVPATPSELISAAANAPAHSSAHSPSTSPAPAPSPAPVAASTTPAPVSQPRFDANYLLNPAPIYPALSRRLGEEGRVLLRVFVELDGRPGQLEIKTSSESPRLDQAALDAVRRWKFVAARRGDEAIGAWVLVPIVFNLKI